MADIYIDPSQIVDGDGSIGSPRNTWPTIATGNNYYQKRGTTFTQSATIAISTGDDNVTLDAYGDGDLPILDGNSAVTANITVAACSGIIVKNFRCINATSVNGVVSASGTTDDVLFDGLEIVGAETCLLVSGAGCTNIIVQNCTLSSPQMNNQCLEFATPGAGCQALNNTLIFTGNDNSQTSQFGIFCSGGSSVVLQENTISGFYIGIDCRTDSSIISENTISDCNTSGIRIRDADSVVVQDNTITSIWNGLQYDGGAGPGNGGGAGAGIDVLDISDQAASNIIRRNRIINCYQGILDQSDVGGGNQFYSNLIYGCRINGISYQSDGNTGYIWNNTVIHHPLDTVAPVGHGIVVQQGSATTKASIYNNIVICDLLGSNIQCINLGGTPGTNYLDVALGHNIYYVTNGAHIGSVSSTNYDTLSSWVTAIVSVTQVTVKEFNSSEESPALNSSYAATQSALRRGRFMSFNTVREDLNGNQFFLEPTIGAIETYFGVRIPVSATD